MVKLVFDVHFIGSIITQEVEYGMIFLLLLIRKILPKVVMTCIGMCVDSA